MSFSTHLRNFCCCIALATLSISCIASSTTRGIEAATRPNILLILLDDAGYSDVAGFADSTAPTPNLQRLADEGVRFTRFYADSTCQPARLSLLTGRQASRVTTPPDFYGISPEVETLPEKLQQSGYRTFHIGKWHLGETTRLAWPSAQGFDHWFGFLNQFVLRGPNSRGEMRYRRPTYENPWLQKNDNAPQQYPGHLEDILSREVVNTIHQLKHSEQPWFINYWTFAPHNPATASGAYLKQFPDTPEGKYRAMLKQMDDNIGNVLDALEKTGQKNNTLVLVLSDNGGTNEQMQNNGPYAGYKSVYSEGGTRVPMLMRWPGHLTTRSAYTGIAAIYDVYPTLLSLTNGAVDGSDGVNLFPLLEQNAPRPAQALFWETATNLTFQYSMLSADGRWRMDDTRLFDLQRDPFAKADIASSTQSTYNEMRQQFLLWRRTVHRTNLEVETLRDAKAYRVTGDSFRRSPGDGPFTFVTSLTVLPGVKPLGVIAEQKGMWSLLLEADQRLHLRMHDQTLVSRPLLLKGCVPLVLSSYYSRSGVQPGKDMATWVVYVNGQEVLLENSAKPAVFPEAFLEPTFVGQGADGSRLFTGQLESPQFYNEFFYSNDPWNAERNPDWLAKSMCQKPQG